MNPFGLGDLEGAEVLSGPEIVAEGCRCDFIVVRKGDKPVSEPVFAHFRRYNIVQYFTPDEDPDSRDLCMAFASACFLVADEERDVDVREVTITLVCAKRPQKLFSYLEKEGDLEAGPVPGTYIASRPGTMFFPIMVVVTSELVGDRYASWRVLDTDVNFEDLKTVLSQAHESTGEVRRNWQEALAVVFMHNPQLVDQFEQDIDAGRMLLEVMQGFLPDE